MYTRQEAAALRQQFWTAFGQYMSPVLSADGEKLNWINYKTGEKDIYFRMRADKADAAVSIEITHKDQDIQLLIFEQFIQFKNLFIEAAGDDWLWLLHTTDEYGRTVSVIKKEISGISVFRKEDWPALISFFKTTMIRLDYFWSQTKYGFEKLR